MDVCAGPHPKRLGLDAAVEAAMVGVAMVDVEAFETGKSHEFSCSNVDFDLLAYTVEGPGGGKTDAPK